ncbi:Hypothetical predicted protein [Mytilus galloprovincialis]|uniref:LRAT domain-containing protein n=1 Tax=Mytilus galloprovincialis TaxID=29158 RepID=A0A8B6CHV3_MYTGA|nr:Hypothetical predicted protein [Mytilus galloprovincialis]
MACPSDGIKIEDLSTFKERVRRCSHVAVYRPTLNIYHHYLVIKVNSDSMVIIHYLGGALKSTTFMGVAEIQEETVQFKTTEHLDFINGVYLIERDKYPKTVDEEDKVIGRARTRLGEKNYNVSSNNCEWFVTWALTGFGTCEQIKNAGTAKRILADVTDTTVCNYRSTAVKTAVNRGTVIGAGKIVASNIFRGASQAPAGAIPFIVEGPALMYNMNSLNKRLFKRQIDHDTHQREQKKEIFGTVSSATGSIIGGTIGQGVIPVPVLGSVVGGAIGGVIGRVVGAVVAGLVVDKKQR